MHQPQHAIEVQRFPGIQTNPHQDNERGAHTNGDGSIAWCLPLWPERGALARTKWPLCDDLDSIGFSRNPSSGDDVGEQQRGEQNTAHLMTNRELVGVVLSGGGPQALGALRDSEKGVRFPDDPRRREAAGCGGSASSLRGGALTPSANLCRLHAHAVRLLYEQNLQAPTWISVNREGSI